MIRRTILAALGCAALAGCGGSGQPSTQDSGPAPAATQEASAMKLTSSAFAGGSTIPADYTCDGKGQSPPLAWLGAPANTQSFALVIEDPDAPKGTFRHWGVYDIPAATDQLQAGASGGLKQTQNDFGKPGYGPPCPPKGDPPHHYHFRLMALDVAQLPGSPSKVKDLLDATQGHVLGSTELVGVYGRS